MSLPDWHIANCWTVKRTMNITHHHYYYFPFSLFSGFNYFLDSANEELKPRILEELITKLMEIQRWFESQRLFKFIASSVLIAFEGKHHEAHHTPLEDKALNGKIQDLQNSELTCIKNCQSKSTLLEVRIIDAAHVFSSAVVDSNYLSGLENVITIFEHIRTNLMK